MSLFMDDIDPALRGDDTGAPTSQRGTETGAPTPRRGQQINLVSLVYIYVEVGFQALLET